MKALLIGDPHFKKDNTFETDIMCDEIVRVCTENSFDFIVILGDVLDTHEKIHSPTLKRPLELFEKLRKLTKKLFVLIGNHDRENNNDFLSDIHPFMGYERDKVEIIEKTKYFNFEGIDLIFVPYVPTGRFEEALKTINFDYNNADFIFAHQEFEGAKMNAITSNDGDKWDINKPIVYSGHIHDYQILLPNLVYVGTPIQHGFSDSQDKKLIIADIEKKLKEAKFERLKINTPMKKKIKIKLEDLENFTYSDNDILKIEIEGNKSLIKEAIKNKNITNPKIRFSIKGDGLKTNKFREQKVTSFKDKLIELIRKEDEQTNLIFDEIFNF